MNLLLYGFVALAIIGSLAGIGYKVRQSGYDSCKVEWDASEQSARKREADLSAFAAKALADERAKKKVVVQERTVYVDKIVDRPVYRNQCFDASGVSCLNAAILGKDSAGCKPDGTMPPSKPAR